MSTRFTSSTKRPRRPSATKTGWYFQRPSLAGRPLFIAFLKDLKSVSLSKASSTLPPLLSLPQVLANRPPLRPASRPGLSLPSRAYPMVYLPFKKTRCKIEQTASGLQKPEKQRFRADSTKFGIRSLPQKLRKVFSSILLLPGRISSKRNLPIEQNLSFQPIFQIPVEQIRPIISKRKGLS
jgi:hypothetical protein